MLKALAKSCLFGRAGVRPRRIPLGLFRGLTLGLDSVLQSQILLGLTEREISGFVAACARKAVSAIDVGAAFGLYSLFFASRSNIREVRAFEPADWCLALLQMNLALNPRVSEKITVLPRFVGDRSDPNFVRLDSIILARPVVLKIDVDGAELEVLKGGSRFLQIGNCYIILETHSERLERDCIQFLRSAGYRIRIVGNAWYRRLLPEGRGLVHNRWIIAANAGLA